ncbi:pyruvate kinase [Streptomyces sp. NPDC058255]|uniref:pyruvate kinase n=1 Tax=Streptomyces sp. NPDC058255 TaxID=3346407 RepID=UPI0036E8DA37
MTHIVITLGPSTTTKESIQRVLKAGVDGIRFPASKFSPEELAVRAVEVDAIAREMGCRPDLYLDLPGSKTRFSNDDGFDLRGLPRVRVNFAATPADRDAELPELGLTGAGFSRPLEPGDVMVVGDGEDALRVTEIAADHCVAEPLTSGVLGRKRGVMVRGKMPPVTALTEQDAAALAKLPGTIFSAVILSFVESAATIAQAQKIMETAGGGRPLPGIIAKVETRSGVQAVTEIAKAADVVLLGRGDLLLDVGEIDFYDAGKAVLKEAAKTGAPVIVGTQLLNSLSNSWLPHRSELAYVSHLLEKGVDGVLLSTETTVGRQPVRTVELLRELMDRYGSGRPTTSLFPSRA